MPTQASIGGASRLVLENCLDSRELATFAMERMSIEIREGPSNHRVAIFYLFNDLAQNAVRLQNHVCLELGSSIFLPNAMAMISQLTPEEKSPYSKTLDLWESRRIFSTSFISRLRSSMGPVAVTSSPTERQAAESIASDSPRSVQSSSPKSVQSNRSEEMLIDAAAVTREVLKSLQTAAVVAALPIGGLYSAPIESLITVSKAAREDLSSLRHAIEKVNQAVSSGTPASSR